MATTVRSSSQLGPLLRALRRKSGLSQEALGRRLGLSQERISTIELHPERITVDQLLTMLMALGAELHIGPRQEAPPAKGQW